MAWLHPNGDYAWNPRGDKGGESDIRSLVVESFDRGNDVAATVFVH
jgi:hypothetical protein